MYMNPYGSAYPSFAGHIFSESVPWPQNSFGQAIAPPPVVPALALPRVTAIVFTNTGNSHPDNCCATCPVTLGVGRSGTASNGMEMRFTLAGHRRGMEYDITRTRRNSLWQQRAGVWTMLESQPMGTRDDRHDADECLRVVGNRLFVIDTPGYPRTVLPVPDGSRFSGFTHNGRDEAPSALPRVRSHADARQVVLRFSFAEWVIVRNRAEGIRWTPITRQPFVFWHSITWLVRNMANQWVLDPRSRIARGPLRAPVINSAPV